MLPRPYQGWKIPVFRRGTAAVRTVLDNPEARDTFTRNDTEVLGNTPAAFAVTMRTELARWQLAVAKTGIQPE